MKLVGKILIVCAIIVGVSFIYTWVTGNDLKQYISDNAIVKEVKVNVHNAIADIDLESLGLSKLTEIKDAKAFNETQSYNFIQQWLPSNYTCKYTYTRGSLVGEGNLRLYTGELGVTDNGNYIDVSWITQKFDSIKEIANNNTYYGVNGSWYLCNNKERTRSKADTASEDFEVYKLLEQVCNERNYISSTITNIVNLGAFDVDMFKYSDMSYVFLYDTKGILAKIINLSTQESYDFSSFTVPNSEKVAKYAAYTVE